MVDRPTMKTIGTKGRTSEDREILMEEVMMTKKNRRRYRSRGYKNRGEEVTVGRRGQDKRQRSRWTGY